MYIALRTGGGRGVYEIAGETATGLTSADLLGREIVFEFPPDLWIPTGVVLGVQGGKHRLRIATAKIQVQRQLAAVLMLPSPRRVNDTGSSPQLLADKSYVLERIHLDFADHLSPGEAVVVPGRMDLRNLTNDSSIQAQQRLGLLRSVWSGSPLLPEPLQTLVRQHEALATAGLPIGRDCEQIVKSIWREVGRVWPNAAPADAGDLLATLAEHLAIDVIDVSMEGSPADGDQGGDINLVHVGLPGRVQRSIIQRRGQPSFRRGLLKAYGYRCQVTRYAGEPALEAAHIYPYSEGGEHTNDLRNGLLLRADIHTLFDLGLLRVVPGSLEVRIMNPLVGSSYATLNGTVLHTSAALRPSDQALALKWPQP